MDKFAARVTDITVKPATTEDSRDIWLWRNDPQTRAMSINRDEVEWDNHNRWYLQALSNPDCFLYVGKSGTNSIGVCRFDINSADITAEVSINLNPAFRGKHLSSQLLAATIDKFWHTNKIDLRAKVKKENTASLKCFESCGFVLDHEEGGYRYYALSHNA